MKRYLLFAFALLVALAASQVPEFRQQYLQRLGGALDEVTRQVAALDERAQAAEMERYAYLRRLLNNPDPIVVREGEILTVTEHGYGKRTPATDYPLRGRGGQGVLALKQSDKTGAVVGATQVLGDDEIMLISNMGTLIRTAVAEVSVLGRNTQGVRIIRVADDQRLVGVDRIATDDADDAADDPEAADDDAID